MEQPILNPPNPYVGTLRIFPGTLVKVSGRARPNATRFAINFQTGPSFNPRDDLALHLSPCFTPPRIIRNTLRHGAWGLEEAWGNGTILNPHQPFEIMILAEPDQFKIAINGAHYCEFKYRIPYQEITHLTIDGDVNVERIAITSSSYTPAYQSPTAPAPAPVVPPYPAAGTGIGMPMPMPGMYPNLVSGGGGPPAPYPAANPYPSATNPYPSTNMPPAGPVPTGASYSSGYPGQAGPTGYGQMPGSYPQMPPMGGPAPMGSAYQGGYPSQQPQPQPHNQQPGHSSSSTFGLPIGGKALGTLAGLGLGAAAGAAVLSAVNPLKHMKKAMKPKLFKHKGWGRSSSSSSNSSISSRSSFSSNSS